MANKRFGVVEGMLTDKDGSIWGGDPRYASGIRYTLEDNSEHLLMREDLESAQGYKVKWS